MRRVHLDEIESLPVLGGQLQWKPVRHELDVSAFGINAYRGDEVGDLVVEEHADRHQELYLVVAGTARFRTGGEEFDARAGTFVLFEPDEHRVAHAAEPGTTVVAVGAEAARFEPSGWEFAFRAKALADLDRLDEARPVLDEGFRRYPDRADLFYTRACIAARDGDLDTARAALAEAIERHPDVREWAEHESALADLT
jgi:mannose-6-phosphate isomerase-like protein (cupin superfamily)